MSISQAASRAASGSAEKAAKERSGPWEVGRGAPFLLSL